MKKCFQLDHSSNIKTMYKLTNCRKFLWNIQRRFWCLLQYFTFITSIKSLIICSITKYVVPETETIARRCSVKKSVLINFAKFTGKYLRQSLFFNKAADWALKLFWNRNYGATFNFIKEETLAQVFSCEFGIIFKNTSFLGNLRWLLL